jgi:hypothetical protein
VKIASCGFFGKSVKIGYCLGRVPVKVLEENCFVSFFQAKVSNADITLGVCPKNKTALDNPKRFDFLASTN